MRRLKNVFMNKRNIIVALVLFLAIGFAAVTTTLVINGTGIFGTNTDDFDVYFSKAILDGGENNALISQDGSSITFETANLEIVGDESVLEYTITNNSTQYDAEVSINCELETNDYVRVDNSLEDEVIEAKSEGKGTLTANLFKTSVNEKELVVTCSIIASATEREEAAEEVVNPSEASTYSMYGELVDENESAVANESVVVYSDPIYFETDENGYFYIDGMEKGKHHIYLMGDKSKEDLESMSESEIAAEATTSAEFTTNSLVVEFPNGYKLINLTIEKTTKYEIKLEANGGILEETTKEVEVGLTYGDLPTPIREGYEFLGWYSDLEVKIESNTVVLNGKSHTLYAKWTAKTYTVTANANGGTIPSTSGWTGSGATVTKTVTYNGTYGTLPTPTRDEYIFKGWYTATSNGTQVSSSTKVTNASNHNIYAIWKSITTCSENICWTDHDKTETKTIGDTIKIGNEEFHIMSFSGSNMQLLSRYNLYVGGVYDYTADKYTAYGTEATGIQNSEMIGVQEGVNIRKGVIAFSSETVHGTNYNTYEGSIVQGHVNKYSSYLKTQYGVTNTGTLITADELKTLGCDIDNKTCTGSAYPWVYGTSYWTRTPRDTTYIYRVSSTGFYSSNGVYDGPNFNGVRPVIIVSTSII